MADDYSAFKRAPDDFSQFTPAAEADQRRAEQADKDRELYDPRKGMGAGEKFAVGAGAAVDRAYRGVRGLLPPGLLPANLTGGDEDDPALYQKYHPGGWATAGEVAGDVAMSAIPVMKGSQVLTKTLGAIPRVAPGVAAVGGDIAANAGYAAATAPENRGEAAMWGGAGAGAGRVLTRTLGGAVRPSSQAQALMDQGVRLTPGQAGEGMGGAAARLYETHVANVPVVGAPVRKARERAVQDWSNRMSQYADPEAWAQRVAWENSGRAGMDPGVSRVVRATPGAATPVETLGNVTQRAAESPIPTGTAGEVAEEAGHVLKQTMRKMGPAERAGTMYPSDLLESVSGSQAPSFPGAMARKQLAEEAANAAPLLSKTQQSLPEAILVGGAIPTAAALTGNLPAAAGVWLGNHLAMSTVGRKVLMGQYPLQRYLAENPKVAQYVAQLGRASATQGIPNGRP